MADRTPDAVPPKRADALLERVLPPGLKGTTILGDLHQEFEDVVAARGPRKARRWYWREALALSARYLLVHAVRAKDGRGGGMMASIMSDLRLGLRMLVRAPGLSSVAVLTIALGVGLTTHTYSMVDGTVLRGLPVPGADRFRYLFEIDPQRGVRQSAIPYRAYLELAASENGFEELAGSYDGTVNLAGEEGPPERYAGTFVTANALSVIGIEPLLGRVFVEGEGGADAPSRIVLSHQVWTSRFASDPDIVGRRIRANGLATEVIGVMPEGFRFPFQSDMWLPIPYASDGPWRGQFMDVYGRIPEGSSAEAARALLDVIAVRLAETYPESNQGVGFTSIPFAEWHMPPEITAVMFVMLAATFGVLLIACANVANLLLARASTRSREVAIRTAIGAGRGRVIRQMLSEVLVLTTIGGVVGVGIAWAGIAALDATIAPIQKPYWIDLRMDTTALLFALAVTVVASLAAGVYPALKASGIRLGAVLRDEGRSSSSLRLGRFTHTLVVTELAVSCALLVAAGLMIKSVANLRTVELGFDPAPVLTGRVALFESDYPTPGDRSAFFDELERRLEALPGVESAALASSLPGLGRSQWTIAVEGDSYASDRDYPISNGNLVTADFFEVASIPLLAGRDFRPTEAWLDDDPVAIANESFVRAVLGGRDPIGMRVKIGRSDSPNPYMRIVGVVADTHVGGNVGGIGDDRMIPQMLYAVPGPYDLRFVSAVVATDGPPSAVAPELRRVVSELDPNLPTYDLGPLSTAIEEATWAFGLFGSLFSIYGIAALFLAAVGLYGVMAFSVNQRRQEMGVRMALGAAPRTIRRMILRRGVKQLALGLTIGLALGYLMAGPMSSVTYGVGSTDPVVYGSIVVTLLLAGLLAMVFPAYSATRADPVQAMRS